jgi:ribonuclease Z
MHCGTDFSGTSAGVPTRSRNVTAILLNLQHPTGWPVVVDFAAKGHSIVLRTSFNPGKLDRIFITTCMVTTFLACQLLCSRSMAAMRSR